MKSTEALVVGGGPVGLLAALCLDHRDVQVRVVDARGRRPVRGYACGLHSSTLTLLNELRLLPEVLALGHRIDRVAVYRDSQRIGTVDLGCFGGLYPYALALAQSDLEDILVEALERRHVPVSWGHEVTHLVLNATSVNVTVLSRSSAAHAGPTVASPSRTAQSDTHRVHYVVGADGYDSGCRQALGIDWVSGRRSQVFAVCEFLADLSGWEHEARVILTEGAVNAFWPLGPNLGRWTFQVQSGLDEPPSTGSLRAWIHERATWFTPTAEELCWGALAEFPERRARRFGSGRIWLAGDSAHSTSPLGFQSLNRGLREASELAAAISQTCHDREPRACRFEHFDLAQQNEWRRLFDAEARVSGDAVLASADGSRLVPCLPATGAELDALLEQLGVTLREGNVPATTLFASRKK
ncbi:MAG TPA: NAD(P)/FAD-dependent oxidoreductase [Polyangiaceae bacterium]|nr:NAD(P)/FAD-dependent oxidoreductase [Polyangiaceae bacterium]